MCWLTERQEKEFYLHYIYSMTLASCSDTYSTPSLIVKHNLTRCCHFSHNNKYDSQAAARNTGNSECLNHLSQLQQQQHRNGRWNNIIQMFTLVVYRYGVFNGWCQYLEGRAADNECRYHVVALFASDKTQFNVM